MMLPVFLPLKKVVLVEFIWNQNFFSPQKSAPSVGKVRESETESLKVNFCDVVEFKPAKRVKSGMTAVPVILVFRQGSIISSLKVLLQVGTGE